MENRLMTGGTRELVQSMTEQEAPQVLAAILDVGEMMLLSGAEVNRVEDTMRRMALAYGCERVDVFTITSSIVVTVHTGAGQILTQTRRIAGYETNMWRIEQCNALSRRISCEIISAEALQREVETIRRSEKYPEWLMFVIYGAVSAVFSVFFGGSAQDAAAACLCGFLLRIILLAGKRLEVQNIVLTILCSAVVGLCAEALTGLGIGQSVDKIIIGNIMLLIPGLALTTSVRDMISGDLISGLLGLCEALIRALAIAAGFALVLWRFGA